MLVALSVHHAAAEVRPTVTTSLNFAVGSLDVGAIDGFIAPSGHFDLGVGLGNFRLQAELGHGLWTDEDRTAASAESPADKASASGSFSRIGVGLRWYWMNLEHRQRLDAPRVARLRAYVESGIGAHRVFAPSANVARRDIAFGFGMAQEAPVMNMLFGGHIGLRVLVTDAPDVSATRTICPSTCPSRSVHRDVAMFVVFGIVAGR